MSAAEQRASFIRALLDSKQTRAEQFVGLLWFDSNEDYRDMDPGKLLDDLEQAGMPKQNRPRVIDQARATKRVVKGGSKGELRLSSRFAGELESKYRPLCSAPRAPRVTSEFLPKHLLPVNRTSWLKLCDEANGCYAVGYYDGAAVLFRRIVEALLIEVYVSAGRESEIKTGPSYFMLDPLIAYFEKDTTWARRSRNLVPDLKAVKTAGDMAAHHRFHITHKADLDGMGVALRRCVSELVHLAGLA